MKTKEFIEERVELYSNDLWERYGIQRDKNFKQFIYSPFPTLEEYLRTFVADIEDPYEELEDENFDELYIKYIETLHADAINKIGKVYYKVASVRYDFCVKHNIPFFVQDMDDVYKIENVVE